MVPRSQQQNLPRSTHSERALSSNSAKRSFRSHSSSFEADDEHSSSTDPNMMGPDYGFRDGPSQYHGEDTRLTSKKELWGWYAYGFAAEVFIVCGMGSFIPICLESLARENGVLLSDKTTPCGSSSRPASGLAPSIKDDQCVIYILGVQVNTASFAMYTFSLSVLFQAILVVSISCAADHGNYRKRLLLFFAYCGAFAMMLFLFIVPDVYLLGALLAVIANTCAGASFVLLNSFLPLLVRHHPTTQFQSAASTPNRQFTEPDDQPPENTLLDSTAALLPSTSPDTTAPLPPARNLTTIELQLSTQISSKGIGIGYAASLFLQCVSITILWLLSSRYKTTFPLRVILFLIGVWWMVGSIPTALWLRPRPGPPLPSTDSNNPAAKRTWLAYIIYAWASLWRTVKLARRLKDIVFFLLAWFLLSDAIATVSGTAVLYAKTTLHMKNEALGLINVIVTTSGVLGAFSWALVSRFFDLRPHQTILACICIFELIPLYGLLGYLPIVKRWGVIGLQKDWEMYPLGAVYGFVLGGLSSYCRSLFGELIPPGSEAAFYALYAITDKGSSVFGPAIVGAIVDRFGEIRPAFWFLAVLVGVPGPIIYFVDVERGKAEGVKLAEVIEGFRSRESAEASERGEDAENLLANSEEDVEDYVSIRRDE